MPGVRPTRPLPDAHRRGRALEEAVAALFRDRGYAVDTNVVRRGRSGARHEVDVLAVRDDGLMAATVAVECKNRVAPVDTEVVARARMLRDDLGVSEVLVVAPGGWGPAAAAAAAEGGVALWGADELARRIGRTAVDAITGGAVSGPTGIGPERRVPGEEAARALRVHVTGPVGLSRERLRAVADAWVPLHEVRVAVGERRGRVRPRLRVTRLHLLYEAVGGDLLDVSTEPAGAGAITLDAPVLPERVRSADIAAAIEESARRRDAVTQPGARERHREALLRRGVPPDAEGVAAEGRRTVHLPVTVGLVARGATERLVVLDAVTGRVDPVLSDALTRRLAEVAPLLVPQGRAPDEIVH